MIITMKYETWIALTEITGTRRGSELRLIDACLKLYQMAPSGKFFDDLRNAFEAWKLKEGMSNVNGKPQWAWSARNRRGACETLHSQIYSLPGTSLLANPGLAEMAGQPFLGLEAASLTARAVIRDERREALKQLFDKRKVVVKKTAMGMMVADGLSDVRSALSAIGSGARGVAQQTGIMRAAVNMMPGSAREAGSQANTAARAAAAGPTAAAKAAAQEIILQVLSAFPEFADIAQEAHAFILADLAPFVAEVAATLTPILSMTPVFVSGGRAGYSYGQAIYKEYQRKTAVKDAGHMAPGDPYAAAAAIERILDRKVKEYFVDGSIYSSDAAVKCLLVSMDTATHAATLGASLSAPGVASALAGPGLSLAKLLAQVLHKVYLIGRDFREMKDANAILERGADAIDAGIFEKCPLLGAYFLAGSTTSNVINFIQSDLAKTGWQCDIEVMNRKHLGPLRQLARDIINGSRLAVDGLDRLQGAAPNTFGITNAQNKFENRLMAKVGRFIPGMSPATYKDAARAGGYEVVSREELTQRIQGMGSKG